MEYSTDSKEYRLAKFSAELADHFVEDAIIFYYLFTEIFLSIDQREKNAFPTYLDDVGKWIVLFYDADSSCGTDNKGNLAFDYYLEDIDYTEGGDPIYNGQNSVLWKNLRATRFDEIAAMYKEMRTNGSISYEKVIEKFENHQSKWPEAIFNEDMYTKCIEPLLKKPPDSSYLPMLQGKKEQWMKWWLYNRFRYIDSKYETGTSMTNRVMFRARKKANVFLKSYVNMYGRVYYNSAIAEHRMERDREYEFIWDASGGEDAVIGINDADMLTSLGDLSPHMVDYIQAANATHITELKVGDGADGYENPYTKSLSLGNNVLLRKLDARNCIALEEAVDVSGCTNIEEVYFDGSKITGLTLPNGGILKTLHLPETIANLTLLNQTSLTEFVMPSFANVTTLRLENNASIIDPLAILDQIAANSRVRIIGFTKTANSYSDIEDFIAKLDTMRGLDENGNNMDNAQVSGTIYIHELTQPQLDAIIEAQKIYPGLVVTYAKVTTYTVTFLNYDDTVLYTANEVAYGSTVEFVGDTPVKENADEYEDWIFTGWNPEPTNVTADMVCYAQYKNGIAKTHLLLARTLSGDYTNNRVTYVKSYAFDSCSKLTSISMENLTTTGQSFASNSALTSVNVPKLTAITTGSFNGCGATTLVFPSVEIVSYWSMYDLPNVRVLDFWKLKSATSRMSLTRMGALETLILRGETVVNTNVDMSLGKIAKGEGYIYVRSELVDSYKSAYRWSGLADQIRAIEDYTVDGTIMGEMDWDKIGGTEE